MKCTACGKTANNVLPITPAMCAKHGIPEQAGVLCINCLSDIALSGKWTGKGWAWLQAQQAPTDL